MMAVAYWMCYIALLVTTAVKGLPNGAPKAACEDGTDLVPSHFFPPSTNPLPYEVDISHFTGQTYVPGQSYNITLRSKLVTDNFKGFMIQGRTVADNSPVGTWQVQASVVQTKCSGETAATHVDKSLKKHVTLLWKAPPAGTGAIRFRYTFVSTFSTYWANLFTSDIQEADDEAVPSSTNVVIVPTTSATFFTSSQLPSISTSEVLPTTSAIRPVPTSVPTSAPTTTTTTPQVSCQNVTGYPECSPDFCAGSRHKFARCSARVDLCPDTCQVTTCRVCIYTDKPVDLPEECVKETCKSLKCVVQWSKCAYKQILTFQLKEDERKPEDFKCFVPNCY